MSVEFANRGIVRDGLIFGIDAFNNKSYISGSTEVYDLNKNGDTGTLINGVTSDGFSLGFNGTNQWVDFLDENIASFDYGDPFSVEFWVKKQTGSVFDWVVGRQDWTGTKKGWGVIYRNSPLGSLNMSLTEVPGTGFSVRTTNQYNDNTWNHHVCVYDGGTTLDSIKIYSNTIQDELVTLTDNYVGGSIVSVGVSARMVIGRRFDESANYPEMDLRTLNIYNIALTQTQVKQNYLALKEKVYGS